MPRVRRVPGGRPSPGAVTKGNSAGAHSKFRAVFVSHFPVLCIAISKKIGGVPTGICQAPDDYRGFCFPEEYGDDRRRPVCFSGL
jgi:hypothetical protein